jgi:hypothetical protein
MATVAILTSTPSTATRQQKSHGALRRCFSKCARNQFNGTPFVSHLPLDSLRHIHFHKRKQNAIQNVSLSARGGFSRFREMHPSAWEEYVVHRLGGVFGARTLTKVRITNFSSLFLAAKGAMKSLTNAEYGPETEAPEARPA